MSSDDLYARLNVDPSAQESEIKKAYRQLSLKYHPDRNNDSIESTRQFQSIGEAYETLGDPAKRRQYDLTRSMGSMGSMGSAMDKDMVDLFTNIFGMNGMNFGEMGGNMGGNMFPPGANVKFTMFQNGVPVNTEVNMGQYNKPTAITKRIQIDIDVVLVGGKIPVEFERWVLESGVKRMETSKVYVDIPKGTDNNETIVMKNVGHVRHDECIGDLKLIIDVVNDSDFVRSGLDLLLNRTISLKDALCGFTFEMKYLNGKSYTITNQTGNIVIPEYNKLIPQMGLPRGDIRGNLIIRFHIDFPKSLDETVIAKLRELL